MSRPTPLINDHSTPPSFLSSTTPSHWKRKHKDIHSLNPVCVAHTWHNTKKSSGGTAPHRTVHSNRVGGPRKVPRNKQTSIITINNGWSYLLRFRHGTAPALRTRIRGGGSSSSAFAMRDTRGRAKTQAWLGDIVPPAPQQQRRVCYSLPHIAGDAAATSTAAAAAEAGATNAAEATTAAAVVVSEAHTAAAAAAATTATVATAVISAAASCGDEQSSDRGTPPGPHRVHVLPRTQQYRSARSDFGGALRARVRVGPF